MTDKYKRAYTEVLEILSHFSEEEYSKIPKEKIEFYKNNMDKDYIYNINPDVDLSEQNISNEANAILISLFRDYFATEKQKEVLNNLLNKNQEKLDEERRKKYNVDVFASEKSQKIESHTNVSEIQLIEYKESFFDKFINFIKNLIKRK